MYTVAYADEIVMLAGNDEELAALNTGLKKYWDRKK